MNETVTREEPVVSGSDSSEAYVNTGHAVTYLNARSADILPEGPLELTPATLSTLARSKKIRRTRMEGKGGYLFKVEWLEEYLDSLRSSAQGNGQPPPDSPAPRRRPGPGRWLGGKTAQDSRTLRERIMDHPQVVFLGAIVAGFSVGASSEIAVKYFSWFDLDGRNVALVDEPAPEVVNRLVNYLETQDGESPLGREIRAMASEYKGPFVKQRRMVRIQLIDPDDYLDTTSRLQFVREYAALVCADSGLFKSRIVIDGQKVSGDIVPEDKRKGQVLFHAFLDDDTACPSDGITGAPESVIINRAIFDSRFSARSEDLNYLDIEVTASLN